MPDQRRITAAIMLLTEMRVHSAHRMIEAKPAPAPLHEE